MAPTAIIPSVAQMMELMRHATDLAEMVKGFPDGSPEYKTVRGEWEKGKVTLPWGREKFWHQPTFSKLVRLGRRDWAVKNVLANAGMSLGKMWDTIATDTKFANWYGKCMSPFRHPLPAFKNHPCQPPRFVLSNSIEYAPTVVNAGKARTTKTTAQIQAEAYARHVAHQVKIIHARQEMIDAAMVLASLQDNIRM